MFKVGGFVFTFERVILVLGSPFLVHACLFRFDEVLSLVLKVLPSNDIGAVYRQSILSSPLLVLYQIGVCIVSYLYALSWRRSNLKSMCALVLFAITLATLKQCVDGVSFLPPFSREGLLSSPAVSMQGRTVLITGSNSGVGFATATTMYALGANVIMACRSQSRCDSAAEKIKLEQRSPNNRPGGSIIPVTLDLSSFDSIDSFVKNNSPRSIEYLFLNAGFATPPPKPWVTTEGYEVALGTMHFGHFFLTKKLLQSGVLTGLSRVVVTSSAASQLGNFDKSLFTSPSGEGDLRGEKTNTGHLTTMYSRAKLANLIFAKELYKRHGSSGIEVCSCHVGAVATSIWKVPDGLKDFLQPVVDWYVSKVMRNLEEGSRVMVRCALDRKEVVGEGHYLDGMGFARQEMFLSSNSKDEELAKRLWEVSDLVVARYEAGGGAKHM